MDLELLVDVAQVSLHGTQGNTEAAGNVLVSFAQGQKLQNLQLPAAQQIIVLRFVAACQQSFRQILLRRIAAGECRELQEPFAITRSGNML